MTETIGEMTTELFTLKQEKAEHNSAVRALNVNIEVYEKKLLNAMREVGITTLSNDLCTVYIAKQVVPNVVNWDAFYEYVGKTNSFHLLERRLTRTAYREMVENGEEVPGVDPVSFDEVRTRKQ